MERSRTVKRKLFCAALGWLAGIALCDHAPNLYVMIAAAGIFVPAAVFTLRESPRRRYFTAAALVAAGMMLSAARFGWYENHVVRPLEDCSGSEIVMRGIVTDLRGYENGRRLTLRGRIEGSGVTTSVTFKAVGRNISVGDEAAVKCQVSTPQNSLTFDKQEYDRCNGVFLEGIGEPRVRLLKKQRDPFIGSIKRIRERSVAEIREQLPEQDGAFLTAILCSDRSALTAESRSAVYRAGLGHLFAVSGTHVVILCSFIGALLDLLFCPARLRSAVMMLFCLSFAVFSGCTPSVVRACIMMSLCEAGGLFDRQNDSPTALGLAAMLITARCPYAMFSLSFMLSFTAAFAIGAVSPAICRRRIKNGTARNAAAVMAVNTLTAPICVLYFSEVSLISAAANLIMIPFCSVCLWLCFLYILTGGVLTPLLAAAGLAARVILKVCSLITASRLSFAGTYFRPQMLYIAVASTLVFAACAFIRRQRESVILMLAAYLTLIGGWFAIDRLPKSNRLTVYPAKYGYTAVIERGDEVLIFDSGGHYSNAYSAAGLAERRHPNRIYLYTPTANQKAYDHYKKELPRIDGCCSPAQPYGADFARFEGKSLEVTVDGKLLVFGRDTLTIGDRRYSAGGFTDISVFLL